MISIWEKNSFLRFDVIVVGAGITGLSTAISLKELNPEAEIVILEKEVLPTGASTKNAGFACFGSMTEILDDYDHFGRDVALSLVEDRVKGLEILKKRIGVNELELNYEGGYELLFEFDDTILAKMEQLNQDLRSIFNDITFFDATEKLGEYGFRKVKKLLYTPFEGQLNPGKMMRALWRKASDLGVLILTGSCVRTIEENKEEVQVVTEKQVFKGRKLVVCTNAFARQLIPAVEVVPARGLVLATEPVGQLRFKGSFHFEKGFYYFRNFGSRLIFGGGRSLDLEKEQTYELEVNEKIFQDLREKMTSVILPGQSIEIEMVWTGIMGFAKTKEPVVKMCSDNVAVAAGLGGMGVALSSLIAQKIAFLLHSN